MGETAEADLTVHTVVIQRCTLRLTPLSHSERAGYPPRLVHDWSQRQETRTAPAGTVAAALPRAAAPG
jgi:hypothetical protein